jgi:hypothetical protein
VERTLEMMYCLREGFECREVIKNVQSDLVSLTGMVTRVVDLMHKSRKMPAMVLDQVEQYRKGAVEVVRKEMGKNLKKLDWMSDLFTKPLNWHEVSTCYEWLLSLEGPEREEAALFPFIEPFRKKFVFHFLNTEITSRPEVFRECVKWVLNVVAIRSEFLSTKVGHDSVRVLLKEMSRLLTVRAKKDIVLCISKKSSKNLKNEVFLELVDELFSWSRILEDHYDYALNDPQLSHTLLDAVFPFEDSFVTSHWIALEKATLSSESLTNLLDVLQSRTRHRLAILPAAWQRRMYFHQVHAVGLERLVGTEYDVEPLFELGNILLEWSMRAEFDQDEGFLAELAEKCNARLTDHLGHLQDQIAERFLDGLSPWLSKNWLYVNQSTTIQLQASGKALFVFFFFF